MISIGWLGGKAIFSGRFCSLKSSRPAFNLFIFMASLCLFVLFSRSTVAKVCKCTPGLKGFLPHYETEVSFLFFLKTEKERHWCQQCDHMKVFVCYVSTQEHAMVSRDSVCCVCACDSSHQIVIACCTRFLCTVCYLD